MAALIAAIAVTVVVSPKANYVWKANFYPGSSSNLRGYPIIEPPDDFTGTWVHYSFTGRPLALLDIVEGQSDGKQVYLRDDGVPYLITYSRNGSWERDELNLGPPAPTVIPWFLPQRWVNRSLNRLAFLDWLFPPRPVVLISEDPKPGHPTVKPR